MSGLFKGILGLALEDEDIRKLLIEKEKPEEELGELIEEVCKKMKEVNDDRSD